MLKKTIKYTDFNDEEVEEDFYFHLSKAELVEMELSVDGGLSESLKKLIATEDGKEIIKEFKTIILSSYGKRSDDGRRFIKTQDLRDEFESSEAYSALFMELVTDMNAAIEFINGVIPKGLAEEAARITQLQAVPDEKKEQPAPEPEVISRADVDKMTSEEAVALGERIAKGEVKIEDPSAI